MSKKVFDVFKVNEYEHKGETKNRWIDVGVAFQNEKSMTIEIHEGINVSGQLVIMERKPKPESSES